MMILTMMGILLCRMTSTVGTTREKEKKRNLMVIVVDDLRPMFGAFGYDAVSAPHMNALASSGFVFHNAYCQQPVCGPSRNSFMTGRYPDQTRVWNFKVRKDRLSLSRVSVRPR